MQHIENIVAAFEQAGIPRAMVQQATLAFMQALTPTEQTAIILRMQSYKPR